MKLTWLGTASVLIDYAGTRLLTDPVFDPNGRSYGFGPPATPRAWFSSTRDYEVPLQSGELGVIDGVLISHDHHADNLDDAGRDFVVSGTAAPVVTNPRAAARLSRVRDDVRGLRTGRSTTIGAVTITATPAQHGPRLTPQAGQVCGFLLEASGEPTVWISGDTVLTPALRAWAAANRGVDVAVVHAGGVHFAAAPVLGSALFTMDADQVVELLQLLEPGVVIPIHRSGWSHFEPQQRLHDALETAGLLQRTRWLDLGEATTA
jgi:L-ascorbate metabolism protein UlaG (beta-lactamase superfamily)